MYIQYKNKNALDGYFAIRPDVQYVVLGVMAPLSGKQLESQVLIMEEYQDQERLGLPKFIPMSELRLIEDTPPSDWKGGIVYGNRINNSAVVCGFEQLLDVDFFVRVHDLDATDEDMAIVAKKYDFYGGNVFIDSNHNILGGREYLSIERELVDVIHKVDREINHASEESIIGILNHYVSLLRQFIPLQQKAIDMSTSERGQEILNSSLANILSKIGLIQRLDGIDLPEDVAQLLRDKRLNPQK